MAQERGRPELELRDGRETTQNEDIIAFLRAAGDPAGGVS